MIGELELFEHLDEIGFCDCIRTILDLLECTFELIGVLSGHLSNAHQPFLLLLLIKQLEVLNNLPQLPKQHLCRNRLIDNCFVSPLEDILEKSLCKARGQVEGLGFHHVLEIRVRECCLF